MRNVMRTPLGLALALAAASAAPVYADVQPHSHDGMAGYTLHRGDRLWFRGAHQVRAGEIIEGDVVVASGSLTVRGEVHGDAVVGGGDLVLEPGSVVSGDAVVTGGRLVNRGGQVLGKVQEGSPQARHDGTQAMQLRRGWFGTMEAGWARLARTLAMALVLGITGIGLIFYGLPQLERVSSVVRRVPANAAGIGLAANVLVLPAFLGGLLGLSATIVGIPFLLLFVPLFWTAVFALAAIGMIAVAHALGQRRAERTGHYDLRHRNPYTYLVTGLALLLGPLLVTQLLGMMPLVGWVGNAAAMVAWAALWLAASIGAGAVLIVAVRAWHERRYRNEMRLGELEI
jgi:hypothetical protein